MKKNRDQDGTLRWRQPARLEAALAFLRDNGYRNNGAFHEQSSDLLAAAYVSSGHDRAVILFEPGVGFPWAEVRLFTKDGRELVFSSTGGGARRRRGLDIRPLMAEVEKAAAKASLRRRSPADVSVVLLDRLYEGWLWGRRKKGKRGQ